MPFVSCNAPEVKFANGMAEGEGRTEVANTAEQAAPKQLPRSPYLVQKIFFTAARNRKATS